MINRLPMREQIMRLCAIVEVDVSYRMIVNLLYPHLDMDTASLLIDVLHDLVREGVLLQRRADSGELFYRMTPLYRMAAQ